MAIFIYLQRSVLPAFFRCLLYGLRFRTFVFIFSCGVMVARQILALKIEVRALAGKQKRMAEQSFAFGF